MRAQAKVRKEGVLLMAGWWPLASQDMARLGVTVAEEE